MHRQDNTGAPLPRTVPTAVESLADLLLSTVDADPRHLSQDELAQLEDGIQTRVQQLQEALMRQQGLLRRIRRAQLDRLLALAECARELGLEQLAHVLADWWFWLKEQATRLDEAAQHG